MTRELTSLEALESQSQTLIKNYMASLRANHSQTINPMSGPENCFFILVLGRQPDMGLNWLWLERKLERRIQKQMTLGEVLCFVWILLSTAKGRVVFSPLASSPNGLLVARARL